MRKVKVLKLRLVGINFRNRNAQQHNLFYTLNSYIMTNRKTTLFFYLTIFLIFTSFRISEQVDNYGYNIRLDNSCNQISTNEFLVHSYNNDSCILWGYINVKGKIQLDIETYETDTKVYMWWTTGQFLMKTPIVQLDQESNLLNIPKAKKARLNIKTVCGTAKVTLKKIRKNSSFKN